MESNGPEFYAKITCKDCIYSCLISSGSTLAELKLAIKHQTKACNAPPARIVEAFVYEGKEKRFIEARL